jgi:transposase-like protein
VNDQQNYPPRLVAGKDYPPSYGDLLAWFPDDEACLDYLDWLRWPSGFVCPHCSSSGWKLKDGRYDCSGCTCRSSVTAGTIFHRTRTPLSVWFASAWHMTSGKNGIAAKTLHRQLKFGSYQTAWTMLHRFRKAMVRPGRDRLCGRVEVDETFIGGAREGKRGRGAEGKTLVAIAVEILEPKGFGRCRLKIVPNADSQSLQGFIRDYVEPGSTIVTDGWRSYPRAIGTDYHHLPTTINRSDEEAHSLLPGVHRVSSLVKRWLLGTHQGAVEDDHLQGYLDEFAFRFNRRHSEFRGLLFRRLLEQAVQVEPISYRSLVVNSTSKRIHPRPPRQRRTASPSLSRESESRPWRRN